MSNISTIEWTDSTWNPTRGCSKVSPGCKNCYAERFANRFKGVKGHPYEKGFEIRTARDKLYEPIKWQTSKKIFVNSMSDLFHEKIEDDYIKKVFQVMSVADWHIFQVLTKRPERMKKLFDTKLKEFSRMKHIWLGVSVENKKHGVPRIDILRNSNVPLRFLSVEPLIEDLGKINLKKIDWVIVGGESGPGAREIKKEWVISIHEQCIKKEIPFFFKQWGGVQKGQNGRKIDKKTYDEFPVFSLKSPPQRLQLNNLLNTAYKLLGV